MEIQIDSRRDYELFVKHRVNNLQVSNKHKATIRKLIMAGFDDGVAYQANGGGKVEVKE
jgi:hypothetical protein